MWLPESPLEGESQDCGAEFVCYNLASLSLTNTGIPQGIASLVLDHRNKVSLTIKWVVSFLLVESLQSVKTCNTCEAQ